jgi:signal transduction histidine kinase
VPVSLDTGPGRPTQIRPWRSPPRSARWGILALRGIPASAADRALLRTFANHAALALERAQLREQALRSELLEEVDRLRHALMGAVSHDLRTPLATMKVASSILLDPTIPLSASDAARAARAHRRGDRPPDPAGHQPARHDPHRRRRAGGATVTGSPVADLVDEPCSPSGPPWGTDRSRSRSTRTCPTSRWTGF